MFSYYLSFLFFALILFLDLFRERLKETDCDGDIDEMVKQLPAYLADRALDLAGGRGISQRARRSKKYKKILQK